MSLPPEQKFLVERRFRLPAGPGEARESTLTWEDLTSDHVVVVLGEPGAGKSTELEREASRNPGAAFLSIRGFLRTSDQDLPAGTLFLDALDEMRASGSNQHEILDRVIQRLNQLGRPRVRLSCRAADWFGELDRSELASASPSGKVKVVELQPLTEGEVEQIVRANLENPSAFLEMVRRQRLEDWLGNPQTLELMIEVARKGDLPRTRTELFEKACAIMATEENRAHRSKARSHPIGQKETLEAAGFLCAMTLLAGLGGFASDRAESDPDFPPLDEIPYPQEELRAAIGSRLFRWQEGRAVPVHRTVAEFLAARTLCGRIRNGLPLTRVLRLITGHDGGTLSDLRGLYAWLTTLAPDHAAVLASRDPVALIFYGDPEPLPPAVKRTVLGGLEKLARQDPWFFYEGGPAQAFGGLADSALIPDFRAVLTEPDRPLYLRVSVLAALAYGHPLPGLQEDLRRIVYDRDSPQGIRELALKALINVVSDSAQLRSILEDVQGGTVLDEEDSLRAHLLEHLYPQIIQPAEIAQHLTPRKSPTFFGPYSSLFRKILGSETPDELVPALLDSLSTAETWKGFRRDRLWQDLVGPLLRRGLRTHGESVPPARLWSWLTLGRDLRVHSVLSAKDQAAVRTWFTDRPQRVAEMYKWWVEEVAASEPAHQEFDFWWTLCSPEPPSDLWRWQLSKAESWAGEERGEALFRAVVDRTWHVNRPTLDELYTWVDRHPRFRETLENLSSFEIPQLYFDPERIEWDRTEREQEAATRDQNIALLQEHIEEAGSFEDVGFLDFLARMFFDPGDRAHGPTGLDRIAEELSPEIAAAAGDGFRAVLSRADLPTPKQIGEAAADRKYYHVCQPLVAGAVLLQQDDALPSLHENTGLQAALACEFAIGVYESSQWFEAVIKRDLVAAAKVVEATWRPLLQKNPERIQHLYRMDQDPTLTLIARKIGLDLLKAYPRSNASLLGQLMRTTLAGTPRDILISFVSAQMIKPQGLKRDQYILWLLFSLLVTPDEGFERIKAYFQRGDAAAKAYRFAAHLEELNGVGGYSLFAVTPRILAGLIKLLGSICPPQSLPESGSGRHDAFELAQLVDHLIDALGGHLDDEAVSLLRSLRDHRDLSAWKEKLSHTVEQQRRKVREQRYRRPSVQEVLKVLEGGGPTSLPDLHTVVCAHLRTLANEIENGPEDGYRTFWNVVGPGVKLQSPLPENEARNRLRGLLNQRLRSLGVSVEIEPHYARANRADLKVVFQSMNIPFEIKRHYHRDVWTAPRTQLRKKYSIDPEAKGFGIYLVFWFGEDEGRRLPEPPAGIARPATAAGLESALRELYSGEEWQDTEFICINCSPRKAAAKKKGQGRKRARKSSGRSLRVQ